MFTPDFVVCVVNMPDHFRNIILGQFRVFTSTWSMLVMTGTCDVIKRMIHLMTVGRDCPWFAYG